MGLDSYICSITFRYACIIFFSASVKKIIRSYRETARKYNIAANDSQGKDRLKVWERIYLEEGAEGLMTERRGRKSTGRPKKRLDKSVEEDLIAENQRLRMEIEYLKKLSALVLAEEQEKNKKQ